MGQWTANCAPLCFTYSPILSAVAGSRPFSSVISFLTSDQGNCPWGQHGKTSRMSYKVTLSNLSTADDIGRIFSGGTPQTSKTPSKIFLWLIYVQYKQFCMDSRRSNRRTLMVNSPTSSRVKIVHSKLSNSASGIIVSHWPEISKSCHESIHSRTLDVAYTAAQRRATRTACENSRIRPFDITGLSLR